MIIHKQTKAFVTRSDKPNENWTNDLNYYVVDDRGDLADKIIENYPYFDYVVNNGTLVDVALTEKPAPPPPPKSEIELLREELAQTNADLAAIMEFIAGGSV